VHYSTQARNGLANGDTVLSEWRRSAADPDLADATSERVLLTVSQPQTNHNGGMIEFGPGGFLFIGLGDGGGAGDVHGTAGNAQNTSTLLGKILRIDVDAQAPGKAYGIPAGNMTGQGVLPELWSYGLRNPWRFSFDACTGDLYIGDVGQNSWEEIDVEPSGQSGCNYGWRLLEGTHCFRPTQDCDPDGKTVHPVAEYGRGEGCSVTGGYVYRGSRIPALRGTYLYADYCTARFWAFEYSGGRALNHRELTSEINPLPIPQISSFGQDATGELYVTSLSGGTVHRIEAK
jgi:glucose/arabinose dehydrogenase